jgi:mono/diheme cytochrome c family protein
MTDDTGVETSPKPKRGRLALAIAGVAVVVFLLIQLVPYRVDNPPVNQEPTWNRARTRTLAVAACFDCHSNETRWPWYADVAPMSWFVQHDVEAARDVLNFSAWQVEFALAPSSGLSVRTGNMPPVKYRMAHPEAQLTPAELTDLANGLDATLKPQQ